MAAVRRRAAPVSALLQRLGRSAGATVLIAAAAQASVARADDRGAPALQLQWEAPAGCPDRDAARAAIEAALGSQRGARTSAVVARVRIARLADCVWHAELWMYGARGSGERSLKGRSCAHVAEATALVIAMTLDVSDEERGGPPSPAQPGTRAAPPAPRFSLGVRATADAGSLPAPTAGAGVALGIELGALHAAVELTAWLPQFEAGAVQPGPGGRFGLWTAGARGCFVLLGFGALQLGPCLGAEVGVATGRGVGISEPDTDEHVWLAGLGGLSLRHAGTSPLAVELALAAGVPLRRPTWEIEALAEVFRAAPVFGRAGLSLSWRFP